MRRGVVLGSIALHAAIGALLLGIDRGGPAPPPPPPHTIDVEIVPPPAARRAPDPGGGASGAAAVPASAPGEQARPSAAPRPAPPAQPARRGGSASASAAGGPLAITGFDLGAPGGGGGEGGGLAGGRGTGLGLGSSSGLALAVLPPPPPSPPPPPVEKPSKARPPKLIYPARDREADDSELFVARLTVDTDGYVVGAHLVRAPGDRRGDVASQLVWRFRYAPALDDDGRAIRSTIDQRFLVGR